MKKLTLSIFALLWLTQISFAQEAEKWTLQRCVSEALEKNISVLQNQLQGEISQNNLDQSKMNRIPTLSGSGSHNYNIGRSIDPFTNTFENQTIQSNGFALNSGVILFGGGQVNNTINQNRTLQLVNEASIETVKNQVSLQVASTYLQIIQAEENLKIANAQQELTIGQIERAEKLVKIGAANQSTVLNLRAQAANDKVQIINAQNQVALAYNAMRNLLQIPLNQPFAIETTSTVALPSMPMVSIESLYEEALKTQPQIKQAELTVTQRKYTEKIAEAGLQPTLSAYGNINTVYSTSGKEYTPDGVRIIPIGVTQNTNEVVLGQTTNYNIQTKAFGSQLGDNLGQQMGLSLSVPIFNSLRNKTSLENAKVQTQISELALENAKNVLLNDITNAYTNLQLASTRYDAAKLSEEAQLLNFEFTEKRFDAGAANTVDLLTAKNQWFQSQLQVTNAKYEYIFRNLIIAFYQGAELKY
jgi:outer membrane protein